ncbi:hypothetical protein [Spiroplasma eriocheiris]|uniref:Transmembrane protein n=1 Tax=Spiroplasma eriocheiris TaxID=315358 RepID=A0A0H3XN19_9MOLU|nr:hypothetical protein [Spiroplasma eriocheiris]AHF58083.1 hypothetical protein SPE_0965 [Spiroplasma eriocheiris CCTCC M 207170]AKM54522.1 hypothetical protein SERIO_v1c09640 [Spiroplasma eriocheiris]
MKAITIKSLVSIANIVLYSALLVIFLILGMQKWEVSANTGYKIAYVLIGFAIAIFVLYHVVRAHEIKKTAFQFTRKHTLFMYIFYITQYFIFGFTLFYTILGNTHVLTPNGICIFWYVWFPIVFVATIAVSVLESIVRVEEKIFLVKEKWKASEEWEKEQLELKNQKNSPLVEKDSSSDTKPINPFLEDDKPE